MLPEGDKQGRYVAIRDGFGLTDFASLTDSPGRSNLFVNSGFMYCVAGSTLFRANQFGTVENLGNVGGSGRAQLLANSLPGDNQIMVLNGIGQGFVYTNGGGLQQVTDPDFLATVSGTVLGERGWFARRDTNELFASEISNFFAYDPLSFLSAEQDPDNIVSVISKKSAVWGLGQATTEYFQTVNDATVPIRPVIGASKERGTAAVASLAEAGERFAWFADDGTVRYIEGSNMETISDLEFELRVRGDDGPDFPGFAVTDDAVGFFIDGPVHKLYYLTFPTEGYTWGYDFKTKLSHLRGSEATDFWRVGAAALFNNQLYGLDITEGKIYALDQNAKTEAGAIMRRQLTCPTLSFPVDWTLPYVELEMEVGQVTDPNSKPVMIVEYSKDGGENYVTWGTISLGNFGQKRRRIVLRNFGRTIRHQDFILRFTVTDDVRVQFYQMWGDINPDG